MIFAVRTRDLRSEQVSDILGRQPDASVLKGSDRTPPRLRPPNHGWFLEKIEADSADPVGLLEGLLDRARDLVPRLDDLRAVDPTTKVTVSICVTPFSARMPFFFSAEVVRALGELGASLDIEFFESGHL